MSYEARVAAAAEIYISRTPVHAQDSDGNQLWTRKQIARAFLAGNAAVISEDSPSPISHVMGDSEASIIECLAAGKPFAFDPATNFLHADDGTVEGGIRYLPVDQVMVYPREATDDLRDVLSMMMWNTGPIAHVLRAGGADIPRKGELEQAYVLHWLTLLVLEHGSAWRKKGEEEIKRIRAALASASEGSTDA